MSLHSTYVENQRVNITANGCNSSNEGYLQVKKMCGKSVIKWCLVLVVLLSIPLANALEYTTVADVFHSFSTTHNSEAVYSTTTETIIGNINATIDEVRLHNRDLSSEEVNASYNTGVYRHYHNFTSLTDGEYTYTSYVQDLSGNINSTTRTTRTDTTPPSAPTLLTPSDNYNTNDNTTTFDWTDSTDDVGVDKYNLQIANNSGFASEYIVHDIIGLSTSTHTLTDAQSLSDGVYYWRTRANDTLGNGYGGWSGAGYFTLTIDTVSPIWTLTDYPKSDNSTVIDTTITWDASVTDTNLYRILLNVTNSSDIEVHSNYTADWNTSTFTFSHTTNTTTWYDGIYTCEHSATDDHTDSETDLKKGKKGETILVFNSTTSGIEIAASFVEKGDKDTDTPGDFVANISDIDSSGQYSFNYYFKVLKPETKLILNLTCTEVIDYRYPSSGILGHIVWDNYYLDFASLPSDMLLTVTKITDYNYIFRIEGVTPWTGNQVIEI
jgi:hypothetical protein